MYTEDELLPVSALQHIVFCERQWGLIHLEQVWAENVLTVQGQIMHERVHEAEQEFRGDVVVARGVALRSLRLGLAGKADVVEFIKLARGGPQGGIIIEGRPGRWMPVPVEYKLGKPKLDRSDEVQLCAQALCLEEMLGVKIERGEIYYGRPRRRSVVLLDDSLREATEAAAYRLHELMRAGQTPKAVYRKACRSCSLYGFLHRDRPGRPSLALDIMEELRPVIADRLALTLVNRKQIAPKGFKKTETGAVMMDERTRKEVLEAYQNRKRDEVLHPFINEKVKIGLLPHIQALLLARHLRGDIDDYPPYRWK
ncbi:Uncharacterized protein PTH_1990 [Pelotomaculum thermopropionicum SI]|uniref:CRISPR-associated exonuclease Cas4 n=1 Tax=Pelotomaculum thermopropionicum (strain DSM 13744 / JCM 10971 / SI) TaxID=370438 RepID=A5D0R5_PELTS|nr:Uncharacterized protein PTH_1990 [Pelotomaculum thermopropionicum SI]